MRAVKFGPWIVCGEMIVATSFMAMLDSDQHPSPETLIARGPLRQIATAITDAACDRALLRLLPDAGE